MTDEVRIPVITPGLAEAISNFGKLIEKINQANNSTVKVDTANSLSSLSAVQKEMGKVRLQQVDTMRKLATETDAENKKNLRQQRDILNVQMAGLREVEKAYKAQGALQADIQKQGALQARAERENAQRIYDIDKAHYMALKEDEERTQKLGALQAKAEREDAERTKKLQADAQKMGRLQYQAELEDKKRIYDIDKAHYMALKEDEERTQKLGRERAMADRKNREFDEKKQAEAQKMGALQAKAEREDKEREYDIDKAHYFALKEDAERTAKLEQEAYERRVAMVQTLGQAFQFAGAVTGAVSEFSSQIGNAFSSMAGVFKTNLVETATQQIVSSITNVTLGSMQSALSRADILNTFVPYMELAGVEEGAARNALNRVDLSIRGLPIGLDESAQRLRRYQMFLGDINKATNITIGLQKAITAGGASEQARSQAYMQVDRLLTVGQLSTARQWNALINGLGISVRFLAQEMGEGDINAREFAAGLRDGTISTDGFLDAIASLGEGTSDAAKQLDQALGIYKSTYESWLSNIRFAAVRGTANLINAVSESLEKETGVTTIGYMEEIRDTMNDMFKGAATFVREGELRPIFESVSGLFDSIRRFSGSEIAQSIIKNFAQAIDLFAQALGRIDPSLFAEFVGFATTIAGPLGKLFKAISSGAPIVLGIFERFKEFDFELLLDAIIDHVEELADKIYGLLSIFPDEWLANIIAFGLVEGPILTKVLGGIGKALVGISTSLPALKLIFGSGGLLSTAASGIASGAAAVAAAGALPAVGIAAGTVVGIHQAKKYIENQNATTVAIWENNPERTAAENERDRAVYFREQVRTLLPDANESDMRRLVDLANAERLRLASHRDYLKKVRDDAKKDYEDTKNTVDAASRRVEGSSASALMYQSEEAIWQQSEKDLAAAESAVETQVEFYNELTKSFYELKNAKLGTADAAQDAATPSFDIAFDSEDFVKSVEDLQQSIIDTYKGEKDNPFNYAEYKKDTWNIEQWTTDLFERNKAMDQLQKDVEAFEKEIKENADNPTYVQALENIKNMGGDAMRAYLEGSEEQREAFRQEAFNQTSISNAVASQMTAMQTAIDKYQNMLKDGTMGIDEAAIALAEVMMNPFIHTGIDAFYHDYGWETAYWPGETTAEYRQRFAETYALHGGNPNAPFKPEEIVPEETISAISEAITALETEMNIGLESLDEVAHSGFASVEDAFSGFGGKIDDATNTSMKAMAGFFNSTQTVAESEGNALLKSLEGIINSLIATQNRMHAINQMNLGPGGQTVLPAWLMSSGGPVYASVGKFFEPRGTDIIPAMLSPGEYVHRKAAVDAFGKEFMDRVNALDIGGAVKAIFHRAPLVNGLQYYTNNNTTTHDSHDTVNQTIYTSNPDYAYRLSDRSLRRL